MHTISATALPLFTTKDGTAQARNHNSADQLTSIAGKAASHDLKGNLTQYEINAKSYQVSYDLDNCFCSAPALQVVISSSGNNKRMMPMQTDAVIITADVDNNDVEYRYDAFGRRVIRKEGSTTSALIWWGNSEQHRRTVGVLDVGKAVARRVNSRAKREAAENQCAEHKHQAGQTVIQNDIMCHPTRLNAVIARAVDGSKFKLQWYHKNYLDHVYAVSDDRGDLLEHYRYTAFGEVTIYNTNGQLSNTTQINNTILWNTRRLDGVTGYYLYKYRHYSPELGRWPSRDPIEEDGGINLYAFVGNEPIWYTDKLGLRPFGAFCNLFASGTIHRCEEGKSTLTVDINFGANCSLKRILSRVVNRLPFQGVRNFVNNNIPDLLSVSLFGEVSGEMGKNLNVDFELAGIHAALILGDAAKGGQSNGAGAHGGIPSGVYVEGDFSWNLDTGSYAGGDVVAGINATIGYGWFSFHATGEVSLLELFNIK